MAQLSGVSTRTITIFGGSGFLGRHVVRAFAKREWRVKVAVRRPDLALHLQPLRRLRQPEADSLLQAAANRAGLLQ